MSIFSKVRIKAPRRNVFKLSHENKFSFDIGQLIPILCEPVVPGDTFKVHSEFLIRMAPMLAPIMQRMDAYIHYFFVPYRLIFDDFEEFITGGEDGKSMVQIPAFSTSIIQRLIGGYLDPSLDEKTKEKIRKKVFDGSLFDFLNYSFDIDGIDELTLSLLPFNAYNLIYNEYYRDQNLTEEIPLYTESKINTFEYNTFLANKFFDIKYRAWTKDYFTSALPFTQRGEDVHIPIYGSASLRPTEHWSPLMMNQGTTTGDEIYNLNGLINDMNGNLIASGDGHLYNDSAKTQRNILPKRAGVDVYSLSDKLAVDGDSFEAATINEFRRALSLQRLLEISARVGGRYKEYVLGNFAVNTSDARLQRPEYLGGGKSPIQISEVLQTSASVPTGDLGDMGGHGIGVGKSNSFKRFFNEHGLVLGIMSVLPKASYVQGIKREWLKMDRLDWYVPSFANIGEQPIYNVELLSSTPNPMLTFGYTPRYAEYKFIPSRVHGSFKTSMNYWHMARMFAEGVEPALNGSFMECHGANRVFAVPDASEHLYCYLYNRVRAKRPMPVFGTPTI